MRLLGQGTLQVVRHIAARLPAFQTPSRLSRAKTCDRRLSPRRSGENHLRCNRGRASEDMRQCKASEASEILAMLFLRCHAAFRTASGLAMAGQAVEAFVQSRVMLENAAYAVHIHRNPALASVWLNRHQSDADLRASRRAFRHEDVAASVTSANMHAGERFEYMYQHLSCWASKRLYWSCADSSSARQEGCAQFRPNQNQKSSRPASPEARRRGCASSWRGRVPSLASSWS